MNQSSIDLRMLDGVRQGILGGHRKDSVDISYIYPVLQGLYDAASAAEGVN